ncbi:hypothetical protein Pmar_PMAR013768 [Perkinsus marinus ATCC 50983]|uniref:Uncharacterized protein n=1 Tax=Perkinsus marinus (strain ATCC 50983 / TXsc) TaxID=423536 RepID=C5LY88_PERM5|nr:hypothetical protein Pmar_PMAR013768 [Perkinsus marinus ATCC 50983]EEQ98418.1 hypothetical protein Pmar_PMAR013768 [Perkinsus marinus ATCC 50983]|eukprot:XP_002765701.1 hypothetical protein Pmar_PMAR013768 [Perkinsus marinus ATCC 50983]
MCLGPGGSAASRAWGEGAKADNQQWAQFAESWWKAFHRRRPVTASKAATSRRSQEEEEEDVSTDDIDWSEEPTLPAVPPMQLAPTQHVAASLNPVPWHSSRAFCEEVSVNLPYSVLEGREPGRLTGSVLFRCGNHEEPDGEGGDLPAAYAAAGLLTSLYAGYPDASAGVSYPRPIGSGSVYLTGYVDKPALRCTDSYGGLCDAAADGTVYEPSSASLEFDDEEPFSERPPHA